MVEILRILIFQQFLSKTSCVCVCVFQYAADAQDKQWLAEKQHMRATGGKMVSLCVHNVCKG